MNDTDLPEFKYLNSMRSPFEKGSRKMSQGYLKYFIDFLKFAHEKLSTIDVEGYVFFTRFRLYMTRRGKLYTTGYVLVDVDQDKLIEEFSTVYNVWVFEK